MTVLIKGGTVVTADQTYRADVLCADGKIVEIGANIATPARGEVVDAGGQYVMPGGIDPHTHMQLPFMGTVASDDFYHRHRGRARRRHDDDHRLRDPESEAAAHGGVQAVARAGPRSPCADYSLPRRHHLVGRERARGHGHAGARARRQQLQALHGLQERHHVRRRDAGEQLLRGARSSARIVTVHAENGDLVFQLQEEIYKRGITGPEGHPLSRPPEVEGEAANRAIRIAEVLRRADLHRARLLAPGARGDHARAQRRPARVRRGAGRPPADRRLRLPRSGLRRAPRPT